MGYNVIEIEEELIYNLYRFEDWLRETFMATTFGERSGNPGHAQRREVAGLGSEFYDGWIWEEILRRSIYIGDLLHEFSR